MLLEHAAGHFRDGLGLPPRFLDWMMCVRSCLTDAFPEQEAVSVGGAGHRDG
ncbi:MAG: hypothetical protein ACLUE8_09800 [Lachnospiraceae bacterium]